jgi:hypothetical protein
MCFSATADIVAGSALLPVAVLSLREVRHWREVPFASLPAVFAVHQMIEAAVWAHQSGDVSAAVGQAAALVYLFIAMPLLPILMPVSVLLLEPRGARMRVAPFAVLGAVASVYLAYVVLTKPIGVTVHPHCLAYQTGIEHPIVWSTFYVAAVIGALVVSRYAAVVAFGVVNLVGIVVVSVIYFEAFTSLWCVYAATASVLILVHMVRRRRLPEHLRLHDEAPLQSAARS